MFHFNNILEARHSLGVARLELMLAAAKLGSTGMFKDTIKEIDDTVIDLTNATNQLTKHIQDA